jgi:hypothetical protein
MPPRPMKRLPTNPSLDMQCDLLFHPERNPTGYIAFDNAKQHPFRASVDRWSRVNAWWLADASWLAHEQNGDVIHTVISERTGLAFGRISAALDPLLTDCTPDRPVWFTGHSLGAAIATLAAYHYRHVTGGVYTFGLDHHRWITKDGHVATTSPTIPHFVEDVFGRANSLLSLIELRQAGMSLHLPAALTDHTPLYYALHTWNDYALNGETG